MKCVADAAYFADNFAIIDDTQGHGEGGGTMPFRLWPAQVMIMWTLMAERLTIILKARQLGISWLCCSYALWLCLFQPGKLVLLYSQGQGEADEMLRRVRVMYERLPEWLRRACPLAKPPNASEIGWANGSRVESLPATQKAGRSLTASLLIFDETAFMQWGHLLYNAAKPAMDGGGQFIVLSTANGIGNLFHNLWVKAIQGLNGFKTVFLPWTARPGRDQAWYDARLAESSDPKLISQEYPATANEAFLVSGRTRFEPDWIEAQSRNIRPPVPRGQLPSRLRAIPGLSVYESPDGKRDRVVIGADVAEGLEHGDYCAAVIIDARTREELASLHGRWEPDEYATHLDTLSRLYGAELVVERNNHGHAALLKLNLLACPHVAAGHDGRPGWLTNVATKPPSVDALAESLRDSAVTVRTQAALDEMQIYRVLPDGKTGAPEGYFDDRVMSWAVALGWLAVCGWREVAWSPDPFGDDRW